MNVTKQKQTHRYREQTSGYQWGDGSGEGQDSGRGLAIQTVLSKISKYFKYLFISLCNSHTSLWSTCSSVYSF